MYVHAQYNTPVPLKSHFSCAVWKEKKYSRFKKQNPLTFQLAQLNDKADSGRNV